MDDALKAFVERQNISNYIERLKAETDAVQRRLLLRAGGRGGGQAGQIVHLIEVSGPRTAFRRSLRVMQDIECRRTRKCPPSDTVDLGQSDITASLRS